MSVNSQSSSPKLERLLSGVTVTSSPGTESGECEKGLSARKEISPKPSLASNATPFLQPWNPRLVRQIFSNSHNFLAESKIQVLKVAKEGTFWWPDVSDTEIEQLLARDASIQSAHSQHTLVAFFVYLEHNGEAQYERQASISCESLKRLMESMEMHDAAIQDLLGRPDYWSAFRRYKDIAGHRSAGYEFFCQHPRWMQKSRHDKAQHRAPCSVYLHHDTKVNTSYYVISAARNDSCVTQILEELGIPTPDVIYTGATIEAAANPFLLHALVSGFVFHQSTDYLANVRERLFSEIAEVNDYSKDSHAGLDGGHRSNIGRQKLENITKNLHLVSQTCDSGIANADMSIRLCEEMLEAYTAFSRTVGIPLGSWRQVQDSMEWILKTWQCQKNWLISYKARKDTAMNFVYNLVTQQDNSVNIDIAHRAAQHSSSMNTITILTMVFLPGTFLAGVFGSGILDKGESHGISDVFWPYIYVFIPLTILTMALWFWRRYLEKSYGWGQNKLRQGGRHKDLESGSKIS